MTISDMPVYGPVPGYIGAGERSRPLLLAEPIVVMAVVPVLVLVLVPVPAQNSARALEETGPAAPVE